MAFFESSEIVNIFAFEIKKTMNQIHQLKVVLVEKNKI
jgi:hypothetical protein